MRHMASAQYWDRPAGGNTGCLFLTIAGRSAPTGLAIVHWVGCINAIKTRVRPQLAEFFQRTCPCLCPRVNSSVV